MEKVSILAKFLLALGIIMIPAKSFAAPNSWTTVGSVGIGIAEGTRWTDIAFNPATNEPYVAYGTSGLSNNAQVRKFDGSSWVLVGTDLGDGQADYISIAFNPTTNEPYVAFEDHAYSQKVTVMKFDGTSWVSVGSRGFNTLGGALFVNIAFNPITSEPYVAFTELQEGTVMKFNGTDWVTVGPAGFTTNADYISIAFNPSNGEPYVAYQYRPNAKVMRFDGSAWVQVGALLSAAQANNTEIAFNPATNEPYVVFQDYANSSEATVMKFDGSNWSTVGPAGFSTGLDYDRIGMAFNTSTSEPYVLFIDQDNSRRATVMKFNGSNWSIFGLAGFSADNANWPSIAFNPETSEPYVAYVNNGPGNWIDDKATVMKFINPTDNDGDGFFVEDVDGAPIDCDDASPLVHPIIDGMVIDENTVLCPGTYNLSNGIITASDDIYFDCNGAELIGDDSKPGIKIVNSGVEVKNCNISNCNPGILIDHPTGSSNIIRNNTLHGNTFSGIKVTYSAGGDSILDNNIYDNRNGVWLDHTSNEIVRGNIIKNSESYGILLYGVYTSNIDNNYISDCGWNEAFDYLRGGISLGYQNSGNDITKNIFDGNQDVNIRLRGRLPDEMPSGNRIWDNKLYETGIQNDSVPLSNSFEVDGIGNYLFELRMDSKPIATPAGGNYQCAQSVSLSSALDIDGASIYYTTDGLDPSDSSNLYDGEIAISQNTNLKAIVIKSGIVMSTVMNENYSIEACVPTASPAGGTYSGSQTVVLSSETPGATIKYSTSMFSIPNTVYSGPIIIDENMTLTAIAVKSNMADSDVMSEVYNIKEATPIASPAGGTFYSPKRVSFIETPRRPAIYYTTDGSTPTTESARYSYSVPIEIFQDTALKAIAVSPAMTDSDVMTETYNIFLPTSKIGVYRPATRTWYLKATNSAEADHTTFFFGGSTDLPVPGDWNGDGVKEIGVFRPSTGRFYLRNTNEPSSGYTSFVFGRSGDLPIAGDWNGDGTDTVGIFRPASGRFYLKAANDISVTNTNFVFGKSGDRPLAGDWDGDGTDTVGLFRPASGRFYLKTINDISATNTNFVFGSSSYLPVIGDWDGDGTDTVGLYRPGTRNWFLKESNSGSGNYTRFIYGGTADKPVAGAW